MLIVCSGISLRTLSIVHKVVEQMHLSSTCSNRMSSETANLMSLLDSLHHNAQELGTHELSIGSLTVVPEFGRLRQ